MLYLGIEIKYEHDHSTVTLMPEVSRFYGIIVAIFFNEHNPPHFHARYGNSKIAIEIIWKEICPCVPLALLWSGPLCTGLS
jgi:hypothetical protein